jgi:peptidyl-prolyl cis-trans isomerase D
VLHQMRSLAKFVWVLVALAFVGGFLLYETSGLMGRTPVTPTTAVAVVNGHEILYADYQQRIQNEIQAEQQRSGRTLSEDDTRRIQNAVFDQMVSDVLLQQQYAARGIIVTDEEIREVARFYPPSWITTAPELQTDGRFDPEKYQRLLASPQARTGGLLVSLENYSRSEIPRQKLLDQLASGVYVTDAELWRAWQDQHDSAQVSYVAFHGIPDPAAEKSIPDAELRAYFDKHAADFERTGRAALSVVTIPRLVTAADSAATRAHALQLRNEIIGGAKFEDVARRESADTASGSNGGELPKGGKGRFFPEFEKVAYALKVGEISQPFTTPAGIHLVRVDERKGDTLAMRHILLRIQPSDSATTRVDKLADELSTLAASTSDQPKKLDTASAKLSLPIHHVVAFENQSAAMNGQVIPSASAWAFGGARVGDTSELFDDDNGYYLARLDTLVQGGKPNFEEAKEEVRARVAAERALERALPAAQKLASAAAGSSLEAAAQQQGLTVEKTPMFSRATFVPGLGQVNRAIGAAFTLPVGAVSEPITTSDAVDVIRVDKRTPADSAAWVAQMNIQRQQRLQQLRQAKVQMYLQDIRKAAKIDDRRKQINAATRRVELDS